MCVWLAAFMKAFGASDTLPEINTSQSVISFNILERQHRHVMKMDVPKLYNIL